VGKHPPANSSQISFPVTRSLGRQPIAAPARPFRRFGFVFVQIAGRARRYVSRTSPLVAPHHFFCCCVGVARGRLAICIAKKECTVPTSNMFSCCVARVMQADTGPRGRGRGRGRGRSRVGRVAAEAAQEHLQQQQQQQRQRGGSLKRRNRRTQSNVRKFEVRSTSLHFHVLALVCRCRSRFGGSRSCRSCVVPAFSAMGFGRVQCKAGGANRICSALSPDRVSQIRVSGVFL
jgi:hypothetical protein